MIIDHADCVQYSRTATITADVLMEYQRLTANATADLEEHLQEIDHKLQVISLRDATPSDGEANERDRLQEERDSTKQCLYVCEWVSEHLDQISSTSFENLSTTPDGHQEIIWRSGDYDPARQLTAKIFKECKERLPDTTSELKKHLEEINERLQNLPLQRANPAGDNLTEQARIQEEKDSLKQCLAICAQASVQVDSVQTNVFEDVSAAQDAHQVIVATLGDLISAKHVTAAARSTQWLGRMSDATVQQLSRDRSRIAAKDAVQPTSAVAGEFEDRHGTGRKLP